MKDAWIFRVDTRPEVGSGHFSRCLALACELRRTSPVHFVLDETSDHWLRRLEEEGITSETTGEPAQSDNRWFGCVIDGYNFDDSEYSAWKSKAGFLATFCDFGEISKHADLVIGWLDPGRRTAAEATVLSGFEYALLDSAYSADVVADIQEDVSHIVICLGSRDSVNATKLVLDGLDLSLANQGTVRTTVVLGSSALHLSEIKQIVENGAPHMSLRIDEKRMWNLLRSADLAVGAGGVGMLERMACGLPSITVAIAENQLQAAQQADDCGGTLFAGQAAQISPTEIAGAISRLASNRDRRVEMANRAREIIDGKGAFRTAEAILKCHTKISAARQ